MPRTKGRVNYNIPKLIEVIEEKLPQGAMGWQEVSALYQLRTQEDVLRDHEDIKRYWAEKLCNKFKKPTGNPGDPTRDRILRCQRIHQSILAKSSSILMGVASSEDEYSAHDDEESEDCDAELEDLLGEVPFNETTSMSRATTPSNVATATASRATTPTSTTVAPPDSTTTATTVALPDSNLRSAATAAAPAPVNLSTAKKQKKRKTDALTPSYRTSDKTKNSGSEKRGSIVSSIDKLATSITQDLAQNNQNEYAASQQLNQQNMSIMMQMMQMQMMQNMMMGGAQKTEKKRRKKRKKHKRKKRKQENGEGGNKESDSSSSSSSSSSSGEMILRL